MKKLTTFITLLLLCATALFAQAPEKFTYQAVVRNASNALVANTQVGIRVNILQGTATGSAVYSESHVLSTNANGLVTVNIGGGSVLHGSFAGINWADGPYFLKTDIDPNGGNDYSIITTQQLLSVPYALYAKDAGNGFSGDYNDLANTPTIPTVPTDVSAFNNDAGYLTSFSETDPQYNAWNKDYNDLINKPIIPTVPSNVSTFVNDAGYITAAQVPVQVNADWNATSGASQILNKPTLFSGNYNDLTNKPNLFSGNYNDLFNKPTIPTVPTNVSAFTNDVGYVTSAEVQQAANIPTVVSAFQNDAGYITASQVPTQVNADWNATSGVAKILNKPTLFSGNYNDLTNKPNLFSGNYNDLYNKPIIPTVPTNVSAFTNDANYVNNTACTDVDLCAMAAALSQLQALVQEQQQRIDDLEAAIGTTDTTTIPVDTTTMFTNPTVSTDSATNVTETTATLNGNITNPDNVTITAQGFEWKTANGSPYTQVVVSGDTLTYHLTGLTANSSYTYRAFITYWDTIVYGNEIVFTTNEAGVPMFDAQPCPETPTLTDVDGNVYNTVQIGDQCWMKENLRTTRYSDESVIPAGSGSNISDAFHYTYNGTRFYNWKAVMRNSISSQTNPSGVQGICPTGWHVPSDDEWLQLETYVSSKNAYRCENINNNIAKALAATSDWNPSNETCCIGNNQSTNNTTGFTALPKGYYSSTLWHVGNVASFWSTTESSNDMAWRRHLNYNYATFGRGSSNKGDCANVRCLKDNQNSGTTFLPTVTTSVVTSITKTSAICGGNITSDGGASITQKGICWSTSPNPTIASNHLSSSVLSSSFTVNLTDLNAETTYYVRAYATNEIGTAYGDQVSFTTLPAFVCGTNTISDYDGNLYSTVQIGTQCWMKENLRTTHYSDGTYISYGSSASTTVGYRYNPNNSSSNVTSYGYLYNWKAVMRNSSSSSANPSGVQGICPTGWHVPSQSEWVQLLNYVSSRSDYVCGTEYVAKALSATTGWNTSTNICAIGNNQSSNNATGFGILPAGMYSIDYIYDNHFYGFGKAADLWSTTIISDGVYGCKFDYSYKTVPLYNHDKGYGMSVRCLRN